MALSYWLTDIRWLPGDYCSTRWLHTLPLRWLISYLNMKSLFWVSISFLPSLFYYLRGEKWIQSRQSCSNSRFRGLPSLCRNPTHLVSASPRSSLSFTDRRSECVRSFIFCLKSLSSNSTTSCVYLDSLLRQSMLWATEFSLIVLRWLVFMVILVWILRIFIIGFFKR